MILFFEEYILRLTVMEVFKRERISAGGAATMKPFKGND